MEDIFVYICMVVLICLCIIARCIEHNEEHKNPVDVEKAETVVGHTRRCFKTLFCRQLWNVPNSSWPSSSCPALSSLSPSSSSSSSSRLTLIDQSTALGFRFVMFFLVEYYLIQFFLSILFFFNFYLMSYETNH